MLPTILSIGQRRQVLMTIYLPHVLDVANYFGIANVDPTRKPLLSLLVVEVVLVPVEIKVNWKFKIEYLDALHRASTIMEPNRISRRYKWRPARCWHGVADFVPSPVDRKTRRRAHTPSDFCRPH